MKKKCMITKIVVMALLLAMTASLVSCSCSKDSKDDTTKDSPLNFINWDGVTVTSVGKNTKEAVLVGEGIEVTYDEDRESNVITLMGKDGYLELPENMWENITDGLTVVYKVKPDSQCDKNANIFQSNLCGNEMGDTTWYDAPEISYKVGGKLTAYIGGRTIDGVYSSIATYNNGESGDNSKYSEPNKHKTRYAAISSSIVDSDKWNDVAITMSKDEVKVYINGKESSLTQENEAYDIKSTLEYLFGTYTDKDGKAGENILKAYTNNSIGNSVYSDTKSFTGSLDDISIFTRELSDSDIISLPDDAEYKWTFSNDTVHEYKDEDVVSDLTKYMGDKELEEVKELNTLSPDGNMKLQMWKDKDDSYYYSITAGDTVVIESSKLGLELKEADLTKSMTFESASVKQEEINETYDTITGASAQANNHCIYKTVEMKNDTGKYTLEVKVFNDGVAYKYSNVEVASKDSLTVVDELSEYILPKKNTTWSFALNGTYEGEYVKRTNKQLESASLTLSTPLLAKVGSYNILFTEAQVFNNNAEYCSNALKTEAGTNTLNWTFGLARNPEAESTGDLDSPGHINISEVNTINGFETPWRVAIISDDYNEFCQSTIVSDLNPEADSTLFADTSWIKPGKVAWSWWSEDSSQGSYDKHIEYIDFASANGWEYVCLDVGWRAFEDRLGELCKYAASKNVGIFVWINYRDMKDINTMETLFTKWKSAGAVGLKTDYFESDEQSVLEVMENVAKVSAKLKLMVLYHGCVRPAGEYRTYPNILTMEAVQGEEWHKWFAYPTVENSLLYPFTRNILGSMDYTPVGMKVGGDGSTYGFGIAKTVVYESALTHLANAASIYKSYNGLSFLNNLATTWDESRYIHAMPGEYITVARRNGENWYIGSMTAKAKTAEIKLDFLGDGEYNAYIYGDNEDGSQLVISQKKVTKSDTLSFDLLDAGGVAVIITKSTIDTNVASVPDSADDNYTYYEAEAKNNTLEGTAVLASSAFCSGSQKVGYVGNGAGNKITFNDIKVDKSGEYSLVIYYCCGEDRKVDITIGDKNYELSKLNSGSYTEPASASIKVELKAGSNSITLSNASYYAPDIDRIGISK